MKAVVVSGVSTGIGFGLARDLCRQGYRVFGTIRDGAQEGPLKEAMGENFSALLLDVTDRDAIARAVAIVERETAGSGLYGLVNNAGICDPGPLTVLSPENLRQHFEVNVIGVHNMTQAFLPLLRTSDAGRPGRIVNISSISGKIAYPFMGPYAASKHALEALSDALRRELMIYGVDVIVIEPGSIDTEIWNKSAHISTSFADTDYGPLFQHVNLADNRKTAQPVSVVTDRVVKALTAKRPKTRYAIPDKWLLYWMLPRLLPDRILDKLIFKALGLKHHMKTG
ncbi:MAG: SDR family oxidoreductase [Alphaproteobacteria bacterium]|nr:SDR family oxidoreductase [Alphaproteobacteria bacterium]